MLAAGPAAAIGESGLHDRLQSLADLEPAAAQGCWHVCQLSLNLLPAQLRAGWHACARIRPLVPSMCPFAVPLTVPRFAHSLCPLHQSIMQSWGYLSSFHTVLSRTFNERRQTINPGVAVEKEQLIRGTAYGKAYDAAKRQFTGAKGEV